jgi:hypothetical protein
VCWCFVSYVNVYPTHKYIHYKIEGTKIFRVGVRFEQVALSHPLPFLPIPYPEDYMPIQWFVGVA